MSMTQEELDRWASAVVGGSTPAPAQSIPDEDPLATESAPSDQTTLIQEIARIDGQLSKLRSVAEQTQKDVYGKQTPTVAASNAQKEIQRLLTSRDKVMARLVGTPTVKEFPDGSIRQYNYSTGKWDKLADAPPVANKYGFSSAGNKILRTNPQTGEVEVAYTAEEKAEKVGASTAYSESQANARQEREQELQKWIREQDNLIRKGDIDARTAKSNLDSQMEFLKWALPKDMKYRPGFEPGGPIARSYAAAGQSYDPESPQNRIMGFVDPFQAAQQMGTPFGSQMQQAPAPAPPPAPPANPAQFAAAQQVPPAPGPVAPIPAATPAFAPAAPPPWFPPGPGEANPLPPWYDPNDPYGGMG